MGSGDAATLADAFLSSLGPLEQPPQVAGGMGSAPAGSGEVVNAAVSAAAAAAFMERPIDLFKAIFEADDDDDGGVEAEEEEVQPPAPALAAVAPLVIQRPPALEPAHQLLQEGAAGAAVLAQLPPQARVATMRRGRARIRLQCARAA